MGRHFAGSGPLKKRLSRKGKREPNRSLPTLRDWLLDKGRNTFYSRLFRGFKPIKITAGCGTHFLVDLAFDQHESHVSFGIFQVRKGEDLAVGVPSFSPGTHCSEKYSPVGRIKVRALATAGEGEPVLEIFIQGIKGRKQELDFFSEAVGMPWPVFLAKQLVELAKKNGFKGIAIPRMSKQPYLKAQQGSRVQPRKGSFPLIAATARALGCKKGKTHYFLYF